MYAPNAPDPRPSNAADYSADDLLAVVAAHPDAEAILAGAYLDYARWLTDWSPPDFEEPQQRGLPRRGSTEWRRREDHKKAVRHDAALSHHRTRRLVPGW